MAKAVSSQTNRSQATQRINALNLNTLRIQPQHEVDKKTMETIFFYFIFLSLFFIYFFCFNFPVILEAVL